MRLFLSSYALGNQPEELTALLGQNKRAAVIGNAADYKSVEERAEKMAQEKRWLTAVGIESEEIDLREYFGKQQALADKLSKFGLVWVRGGNVFLLRYAMQASGFDDIVQDLLSRDAIVYGGYSAAACVLAPTLDGFAIVDDPNLVPLVYGAAVIRDGLGVLDYSIEPHHKSDYPGSADVDKEIAYLEAHSMPYKTLRDGEVLVINGNSERVIG